MLRSFIGGAAFGSVTGTGPPGVLALHGWGRTHRDFDATLAAPGAVPLDALALDLPGFGATPAPDAVWGPDEYADFVARVLDEMATPVVVLGHSFGGRVAVHLAARRPEAVHALVVSGSPLLASGAPARPPVAFTLLRRAHRAGLLSDERMEAARRRYGSSDYRNAEGVMRQILVKAVGSDDEVQLGVLRCPVELVWGELDTAAPPAVAERAAAMLADARLEVLAGLGHMTPLEAPAALRGALERVRHE